MKKFTAMLLALVMVLSLMACGKKEEPTPDVTPEPEVKTVYAVEAGSAGEAVAQEKGWEIVSVDSQAKALMEVNAGTSNAAIIDLLMAGAMIGEGTSYPDLKMGEELTVEEYGIGCRKGSDLAQYINQVLYEASQSGEMLKVATTYGIDKNMIEMPAAEFEPAEDSDYQYIVGKGKLVVGITDFAPMDYKNDAGEWIGFDADMAKIVAEKMGVEIEFVEIDWDNKIFELEGKTIDVVWNGMTLTDEVMNAMECTNPYCKNAQVIVTK